ncbi:MAG: 3-phosphoglycerate dehydrogenase [Candidatus Bathyarchaeum sp.]|nr:MAG: 3-phosphoglycerate dehydrogenase [Candidatus Bathyarchaeum sp.]
MLMVGGTMRKHTILVCDNFGQEFLDHLSKFGEVTQANDIDPSMPLNEVTILVVRSKTKVNKELVNKMRSLECVITATHGLDHIDLEYLTEKGIAFFNIPVQSYDVAQGVIAYILAYSTNLLEGDRSMKRGEWKKKSLIGCRITGKALGIIGCGKIGREVARLGAALGMKVIVSDPCLKDDDTIVVVSLEELLKASDFISLNCPLTEETRHLIGREEIALMKDGAFLVNTARGGIVDDEALLDAVRAGKIGAALDVYESSAPFENDTENSLIKSEGVMATPHSIGQTIEAIEGKGKGVLKAIKDHIASS